MGIAICAYIEIEKIDCLFDKYGEPVEKTTGKEFEFETVEFYKNPHFEGRCDDIEDSSVYKFNDSECFVQLSYGGYGFMRNLLAKLAGYKLLKYTPYLEEKEKESYCVECWDGKDGPFSEVINFSDCEGVIGATVSAKLSKDFEKFQEKAEDTKDERFIIFYNGMKSAFEMASKSGAVKYS